MDGEQRRRGDGRRGEYWTRLEMEEFVRHARAHLSTLEIAKRMLRTPKAIRNKASQLGVSLSRGGAQGRPQAINPAIRRVVVTADFDISGLSAEERRALAARLLDGLPVREVVIPETYDPRAAGRAPWEAHLATLGDRWTLPPKQTYVSADRGPSRRQRRKEKRLKRLEAWYQRQLAPKPAAAPGEQVARPPFDPFDELIDFGPDAQPRVWDEGD